ncbi:hypothetical protein [Shewanella oncorhynchi]|uniref:hypothetical protein n=2 Tax=Shewanella TaxID=22 RepID=UPI003D79DD05|nr:hypothetical protein [Shewanella sp. SM101]
MASDSARLLVYQFDFDAFSEVKRIRNCGFIGGVVETLGKLHSNSPFDDKFVFLLASPALCP